MSKQVRVTFVKQFTVRDDQDHASIGRMYKDCYGMDVIDVEEIHNRCDICDKEVTTGHRDVVSGLPRHPTCIPY